MTVKFEILLVRTAPRIFPDFLLGYSLRRIGHRLVELGSDAIEYLLLRRGLEFSLVEDRGNLLPGGNLDDDLRRSERRVAASRRRTASGESGQSDDLGRRILRGADLRGPGVLAETPP